MKKLLLLANIIKNILQFAVSFFVVYLCIRFTPLKYVDKELLNTIAIAGLLLLTGFFILFSLSKLKYSKYLIKNMENLEWGSINNFSRLFGFTEKIDIHGQDHIRFKNLMEDQIKKSNKIYMRLLSGRTMYFDGKEKFILDALKNLPPEKLRAKDIKIQLVEMDSPLFMERAGEAIASLGKTDPNKEISINEYIELCKNVEADLVKTFGEEKTRFYQRKYLWRLHIFDDMILISNYGDGPSYLFDSVPFTYLFYRKRYSMMFDALLAEFNSLYKRPLRPKNLPLENVPAK